MENLEIYEAARAVPEEAKKPFNNGKFSGTDINPMWRIKKLTELFGPAGFGWYYDIVSERAEQHGDVTIAIVDLNLYVKYGGDWSKPIYGTGGNIILRKGSTSDEGYKMALTDALSVACKALGIGADVYFEKNKTKYTSQTAAEDKTPQAARTINHTNICADCGKAIGDWVKDGVVFKTALAVAQDSEKEFKRPLCISCIRKVQAAK